jgi:uncharacterized protein YjbI with pentapeptide repeats
MADSEQLAKLKEGVKAWNSWREKNPEIPIDLTQANLRDKDLSLINLSEANLNQAKFNEAKLRGADLRGALLNQASFMMADLIEANLSEATLISTNLNGATLVGADLINANLTEANLRGASLGGADLNRSDLSGANLTGANLNGAILWRAYLRDADLTSANLWAADLTHTNLRDVSLRSANLQTAKLDQATLTGAKLWETQRARWSIKGTFCEYAYWDEAGEKPDHYAAGEFERLYSHQTRIELLYPGGMTTFELNTLPALLHHLTSNFPNSGIRLNSMQEAGGGAKISITVQDPNPETIDDIRAEATRSQSAQIALRDDEITRLKIQKQLLLDEVFPRMLAAAPQFHFADRATNVAIAVGGSSITAHQAHNDTKAILAVLDRINSHREELAFTLAEQTRLEAAIESVRHELSKPEPKSSLVSSGLKIIKETATKALESAAEKAITEHWHEWLIQLTTLMHHYR